MYIIQVALCDRLLYDFDKKNIILKYYIKYYIILERSIKIVDSFL